MKSPTMQPANTAENRNGINSRVRSTARRRKGWVILGKSDAPVHSGSLYGPPWNGRRRKEPYKHREKVRKSQRRLNPSPRAMVEHRKRAKDNHDTSKEIHDERTRSNPRGRCDRVDIHSRRPARDGRGEGRPANGTTPADDGPAQPDRATARP